MANHQLETEKKIAENFTATNFDKNTESIFLWTSKN